jgi:hypothetical protein
MFMRARLKLKPGQPGTKALVKQYGDKLLCVRYRYDAPRKKRYKTIELIVDEADWEPKLKPTAIVLVQVKWGEVELSHQVRSAGGTWNKARRAWELPYAAVVELQLENRIVNDGI